MKIIEKLRGLSEANKKLIIILVVALAGFLIFKFYLPLVGEKLKNNLQSQEGEGTDFPDINNIIEELTPDLEDISSMKGPFLKETQ